MKKTATAAATPDALGDPLDGTTPDYRNDGTDTAFDQRAGDHHDGMEYLGLNAAGTARDLAGSARGILAVNHEAITDQFLHANGVTSNPRPRPKRTRRFRPTDWAGYFTRAATDNTARGGARRRS